MSMRTVKAFYKRREIDDEALEIIHDLVERYKFDLKKCGEHLRLYAEHTIEYKKLRMVIDKIRHGTYKNKSKAPLSKIFDRASSLNASRESILRLLFPLNKEKPAVEDKPRKRKRKTKSEKAAEDFGI